MPARIHNRIPCPSDPAHEIVVASSRACMPGRCMGGSSYRRIVALEVMVGTTPRMLSPRARGVVRVLDARERLYVGKTKACAFRVALADVLAGLTSKEVAA